MNRKVLTTQGNLSADRIYNMVYPYNNLNPLEMDDLSTITEKCLLIQEISYNSCKEYISFDVLITSLSYLKRRYLIDFSNKKFVDCLGRCGIITYYASVFNFSELRTIETATDSYENAIKLKYLLKNELINKNIEIVNGSIHDYFCYDSDVIYIDCYSMRNSIIDEGILLRFFFQFCMKVLPGTVLIVSTNGLQLTTEELYYLGYQHIECLFHKEICYNDNHNDSHEHFMWILRTVSISCTSISSSSIR